MTLRRILPAAGLAAGVLAAAGASAAAQTAPSDPVVGRVDGQEIRLSDVDDAAKALPDQMRQMPPAVLFPMVRDQLIDRLALTAQAKREGLDKDPAVHRQMEAAADRALQTALLSRDVGPKVSDDAVRARYEQELGGKAGPEEVHASHILVPTEDEAKKIIAELKGGAKFADLAKKHSKDPAGAQGGDLGWFKQDDMVPEFAAAAFAMKPGETSPTPVKTQFGWHVIHVEDRRQGTPPSFDEVKEQMRQRMIQDAVTQVVERARTGVDVQRFTSTGAPEKATDSAEPPPAPK